MPEQTKFLNFLGIIRKAGQLQLGYEKASTALQSRTARAAVIARDVSDRVRGHMIRYGAEAGIPVLTPNVTSEELSSAVGQKAGAAAVCDKRLANKLIEIYNECRM